MDQRQLRPQKELDWGWGRFSPLKLLEGWWVLSRVKLEVDHQVPGGYSHSGQTIAIVEIHRPRSRLPQVGRSYEQVNTHKSGSFEELPGTVWNHLTTGHQVRNVLLFFLSHFLQPWKDQKPASKGVGGEKKNTFSLGTGFLPKAGPIWGSREKTYLWIEMEVFVTIVDWTLSLKIETVFCDLKLPSNFILPKSGQKKIAGLPKFTSRARERN